MSLISTNIVNLPTPSDYQPDIEILENSNRNALGDLLREIINYKIKINLKYNYLPQSEFCKLQQLRKSKSFECTYWDSETGTKKTITCMAGSIKATPIRADSNGIVDWKDITVNFIEF